MQQRARSSDGCVAADSDKFIHRQPRGVRSWAQTTNEDVVGCSCWLDARGRGHTGVHNFSCVMSASKAAWRASNVFESTWDWVYRRWRTVPVQVQDVRERYEAAVHGVPGIIRPARGLVRGGSRTNLSANRYGASVYHVCRNGTEDQLCTDLLTLLCHAQIIFRMCDKKPSRTHLHSEMRRYSRWLSAP